MTELLHEMKNVFASASRVFVAATILLLWTALPAFPQSDAPATQSPLPAPTGPVNDYAGVIDQAALAALNTKLTEYQRSTGVEIAVAVVRTTGDQPIFDYSFAVARGWGIGSKGDDNPSLLLFIAVDDRKYFTQISRDLEDELPDALAGSIQRQYLVPEFKRSNYSKGIVDTVDAYIRTIDQRSSGTAASPTPVGSRETQEDTGISSGLCCLLIVGLLLLIILSGRGSGNGGGSSGGSSILPWIIGSAIGSSLGSGSSSGWGSGSGGWSSGSSGSSWGGFGGGGDFGGGGAGGGW